MPTPSFPPPDLTKGSYEAPKAFEDAVYLAVGKFIHEFAATEVGLSYHLANWITENFMSRDHKTTRDILAGILGSSRFEGLKGAINRVAEKANIPDDDLLKIKVVFDHLSYIQFLRNRIAHHGAYPIFADNRWCIQTSNKYNVADYDKREMIRYTVEDLENACTDLSSAETRIFDILNPKHRELMRRVAIGYIEQFGSWKFSRSGIVHEAFPRG